MGRVRLAELVPRNGTAGATYDDHRSPDVTRRLGDDFVGRAFTRLDAIAG